jgi:hypothetical protein
MARSRLVNPGAVRREGHWLLLLPCLLSACASTSTDDLWLYPAAGAPQQGVVLKGRLTRSCRVGNCPVQHATLAMPDGEVLEGEIRMLSAGTDVEVVSRAPSGPLGPPGPTPGRSAGLRATMTVHDRRTTEMRCEMTLARAGRHGAGFCWNSRGSVFRAEF